MEYKEHAPVNGELKRELVKKFVERQQAGNKK